MNFDSDFSTFSELLGEMFDTLAPERGRPDAKRALTWFKVLAPYPLAAVVAGVEGHMRRPVTGRTLPIPSDIVAQIDALVADDGRPGPEEAFTIAMAGRDEQVTVVWTSEIAEAWGVARHNMATGDEVGARMAFREKYNAIIEAGRRNGTALTWQVAEGFDPVLRVEALRVAAAQGRIPHESVSAAQALPAPRGPALLLSGPGDDEAGAPSPRRAAALQAIRDALGRVNSEPSADAVARQETAEMRREAEAKVQAYVEANPESMPARQEAVSA